MKWQESWRNAEDRVAQCQFELEEARKRIAELEEEKTRMIEEEKARLAEAEKA